MNLTPLIQVRVLYFDGTPVPNVHFSFRPLDGNEYRALRGRYDSGSGVYTFLIDDFRPGRYLLRIEAPDYEVIEKNVEFGDAGYSTDVFLVEDGIECVKMGGRRVYFRRRPELVGVHVSGHITGEEFGDRLEKAGMLDARPVDIKSRQLIFETVPHARKGRKHVESLRNSLQGEYPDAVITSQGIEVVGGHIEFLSRNITVELQAGIKWEDVQKELVLEHVAVIYHDPAVPSLYVVEVKSDDDYAVLDAVYRLQQSPLVKSSEPQKDGIEENCAPVLPNDLLRPWQWHLKPIRMPQTWELLKLMDPNLKFGSADVILAIHDGGIETSGLGVVRHPDLTGSVPGGNLTAYLAGNNNKVYFQYNFSLAPGVAMVRDNDIFSVDRHGIHVTGVATAKSQGGVGVVGVAPNVRLASFHRQGTNSNVYATNHFQYMSGFRPVWVAGVGYVAGQVFPPMFRSEGNVGPAAFIINCSHTKTAAVDANLRRALTDITLRGRDRRGVVIVAAAGNSDTDTRTHSQWGNDVNVLKIGASSFDHLGYEIISRYSAFSINIDPGIDVCAPSSSSAARNNPPRFHRVVTTDQVTAYAGTLSKVPGTNVTQAVIQNNPAIGDNFLTLLPADLLNFPAGTEVLIRHPGDIEIIEHNTIIGAPGGAPPNSVGLTTPLDLDFPANSLLITGLLDYVDNFGGTSSSSPVVSGLVALMLSANPSLNWAEVRQILRDTSIPIGLRVVGPGGAREKRWLDPAGADVIDANGVMVIPGGAPTTTITTELNKGDTQIVVANANVFTPRQAITIGAESRLSVATDPTGLAAPANQLTVARGDDFENGDVIHIGKLIETLTETNVVAVGAPGTGISLRVVNTDGFVVGDILNVGGQQVTLVAINATAIGAASNSRNIFVIDTVGAVAFAGAVLGTVVRIGAADREGPFTITAKVGNQLTLNANVTQVHPVNRMVQKENTEVAVVKRIASPTALEMYPLINNHLLNNIPGNLHITGGRIAFYSRGFGYGRIDAYEAVKAAINYSHDERDLMIRNFVDDDGVTNRGAQPVASPDLWVANGTATPVGMNYATPGPHQNPRVDISAPIFIGSGLNDLAASGVFAGVAITTYIIEITATGAADSFTWRTEGGVVSAPIVISGAAQVVDVNGLSVAFNAVTGHTVGDKWYIRCENIGNRFVHLRLRNRGTLPTFAASGAGGQTTPVYQYRIFLSLSDGTPIVRYLPFPGAVGLDDLRAVSDYTGAAKDIITITITATGAADSFTWSKGSGLPQGPFQITGAAQETSNEVSIQFGAVTGHTMGDIWVLKCYPAAQKFMNIDHFIESNPAVAFNLSANRPGTWLMTDPLQPIDTPAYNLPVYAAGQDNYYSIAWPENNRPPRNGFGAAAPARPLRMFIMGEVTPHDGKLKGDIPELDNNFSYREIIFARFGFKKGSLTEEIASYIEVDSFGTVANETFLVQVISDASTYRAESVRLEFVAELDNGTTETKVYEFGGVSWNFAGGAPSWCTMAGSPKLADGATNATGEQYYMTFSGTLNASRTYKNIKITPKIYSAVNAVVVLAEESRTVAVYEQAQLASGRYTGISPADLAPHSHFFTDIGAVLVAQDPAIAYGPVSGDTTNKFRVTGLLKATGDVNAYAVVDGIFMIQRVADPGTPGAYLPNVINLVLKPYKQAMLGFTPVKYFIYRNLRLDNFLKGISATDEKLVHDQGTATAFIQSLWALHTAQNGAVPFESNALGFDLANQAGGDKIDKLFHRQDPNKQLPFVGRGTNMGKFYTNGGADEFGLEIILEEGEFQPDYTYVRKYKQALVDLTQLVAPTPFTTRLEREKVLNYIDPAAFFGMHMAKDGWLQVDDGAGNKTKYSGADIYDNVISKFHTRNTLYVDIRNENALSLNFYGKYDDGTGKALEVGNTAGALAAQSYASDQWPLIIRPSVSTANPQDYNQVFLRLRRDYNKKPILYLEHGQPDGATTTGRFIAGDDLIVVGSPTTNAIGLRFPNKDLGAGNRIGVSWLLKLHYTMRQDAANSPFPPEVVPTASYLDNLFGPIDIDPLWAANSPVIAWLAAQDKKYVDGQGIAGLGFEHIADRGVAFSQWNGTTSTTGVVLFYAAAKDNFENANKQFIPHNGLTGGVSKRGSFFEEALLFDGYTVGFDVIVDGSTEVLTMSLQETPPDPRPAEAMLLLGLTKNELETHLKSIGGFDNRYPRTILLGEVAGSPFTDVNGEQYRKYKAGLRGMKNDGTAHQAFPGTDVIVYTTDQKFFFSHAFTQAQPLPASYSRNYDEKFGALLRTGAAYPISLVAGSAVTVPNRDLTREIVPGDKVRIKTTNYTVSTVTYGANNSIITLTAAPAGVVAGTDMVYGPSKRYEEYYIAKDRLGILSGIDRMEVLVDDFVAGINAIPDNTTAPAAIEALINNYAFKILQRGRLICSNGAFANADDRILYWARIKMVVALKNHPYMRKTLTQRKRLAKIFEDKSRGYDSVSFAAAGGRRKVLITGYDPYQLDNNIKQSNPSGAAVLAMHGQNFALGAADIHVQTAIFPMRYADFDQNPVPNLGTGVVENFFERFINTGHPDYVAADVPDIIVTLNQGGPFEFRVERFAARNRGSYKDNLNAVGKKFPATVVGDQFYENLLPEAKIVPAGNAAGVFKVFYSNVFDYTWTNAGVATHGSYLPLKRADGTFIQPNSMTLKIENPVHPDHSTRLVGSVPSVLTNTTTPKKSAITAVQGSGGSYLSNEIYYRVARLRHMYNPTMKTGHYSLPAIQHRTGGTATKSLVNPAVKSTEDFSPDLTRQLIEEIRNSLLRIFL